MKKVVTIHTSFVSVNYLASLFEALMPEVQLRNIVDDSLLAEIVEHGGITPNVVQRYCAYALQAQRSGADLIFNQCSSAGFAADIAAKLVDIPIVKVDQAMAEEAVQLGSNIVVVATVASTIRPSVDLVVQAARAAGKDVTVSSHLVEGALDILMKEKNQIKHNHFVMDALTQLSQNYDVIVLAQGSMVVLQDDLHRIKIPVLTSPRSGVLRVRSALGLPG